MIKWYLYNDIIRFVGVTWKKVDVSQTVFMFTFAVPRHLSRSHRTFWIMPCRYRNVCREKCVWKENPITLQSPLNQLIDYPDNKVHGADMGPIWGQQDPDGPHVGPMNFAIWVAPLSVTMFTNRVLDELASRTHLKRWFKNSNSSIFHTLTTTLH